MEDSQNNAPSLLEARTLPNKFKVELVRCCPTMDLTAYVMLEERERIDVYRFGGQRAFSYQRREPNVKVISLCWKYNGQYLAICWSDGLVDVLSSETGVPLQIFRQLAAHPIQDKPTSCVGWGLSLVDPTVLKGGVSSNFLEQKPQNLSDLKFDDLLDRDPDIDAIGITTELSDQLAQLDVTDLMPKLPIITMPTQTTYRVEQGPLADLFASQALLDSALRKTSAQELHALNAFLASNKQGALRVIVYDSLNIGDISMSFNGIEEIQHIAHSFHPFAHSHVLLSKYTTRNITHIALIPVSFRFLKYSGKDVHLIASKAAQLEILVQYIGETILALEQHWKSAQDLPMKFQRNISESLEENSEPELPQSLYQLAATGYCSDTLHEWLTDQLDDRGQKRWEAALIQGYVKVLELLQENLLPSLDRFTTVLSSLRGLAQYHEHSPGFDIPLPAFNPNFEAIKCIQILAHNMIIATAQEYHWFLAFTKWFRHSITIQKTDPTSQAGEELMEKDPGIDYMSVLSYIEHGLANSVINNFLFHKSGDDHRSYDELKVFLQTLKKPNNQKDGSLNLSTYYKQWKKLNESLVYNISSWQKNTTVIPGRIILSDQEPNVFDIRMVYEGDTMTTYVLLNNIIRKDVIKIFQIRHSSLFDDISSKTISCRAIELSIPDHQTLDLKFVDDHDFLILIKQQEIRQLISLPYRKSGDDTSSIPFEDFILSSEQAPKLSTKRTIEELGGIEKFSLQKFGGDGDKFSPVGIQVNGRKNRRTVIVVGDDQTQARIYDLGISE